MKIEEFRGLGSYTRYSFGAFFTSRAIEVSRTADLKGMPIFLRLHLYKVETHETSSIWDMLGQVVSF